MKHVLFAIVATALSVAAPAYAAGDDAADRERARELLDQGNKRLESGDADGAIDKFQEALRAYRSPKIHVNLAEAHRIAGRPAQAVRHYEIFMARGTSKPSVLRKIEKRARELEPSIGRIELDGELDGATVNVGGWRAPWRAGWRIPVDPGRHLVVVSKEGRADFETHVEVAAGQLNRLDVELAAKEETPPIDLAARPAPPPPLPPSSATTATMSPGDDKPLTKQWWFWAGVGGAIVAVVAIGLVAGNTGGDDRLPMGDLSSNTSDWGRL
ncbi:MAG: PEGA domain-containing protein [Deltaproteobacteria bacterium]